MNDPKWNLVVVEWKLNSIEKADESTHYVLFISDLVGAASGHGGYCEQGMFCIKLSFFKIKCIILLLGIPTETALLALLAAFGVSFAILYMASTTNTGRKKRELLISDQISDILWSGK